MTQPVQNNKHHNWLMIVGIISLLVAIGLVFVGVNSQKDEPINESIESTEQATETREELIRDSLLDATYIDYLIIGNEYVTSENYEEAEKNYLLAYESDPEQLDVLFALAKIYRLQEMKEESLSYYDRVIALASDPSNPYHVNLSFYENERVLVEAGDFYLTGLGVDSELPL